MRKFTVVFVAALVLAMTCTGWLAGQDTKGDTPKVATNLKNADVKGEDALQLQVYALRNRAAKSDYNNALQQIPELKQLLDEINKSAQDYIALRNQILKAAGVPETDYDKYDVDTAQKKIMLLPAKPAPAK